MNPETTERTGSLNDASPYISNQHDIGYRAESVPDNKTEVTKEEVKNEEAEEDEI